MGGIGSAEHVLQFRKAGADLFGIGSALTGMDNSTMRACFAGIQDQLTGRLPAGEDASPHCEIDMSYFPTTLASRTELGPNMFKIVLESLPNEYQPGELGGKYFFLWIPGVGEKPFAVFSAADKSIVVRAVGVFTRFLKDAEPGTKILLRGPYGAPPPQLESQVLVLVGGGTGAASLLEIGHSYETGREIHFLLGARSHSELFDLDLFGKIGTVHVSTDDGTAGYHGLVTGLLREVLATDLSDGRRDGLAFINCGPEPMVHACLEIQRDIAPPERILASIEYVTSCGVGICGKCASPSGSLTCIDGPFLPPDHFVPVRRAGGCS
jgi:dihydroorotate dehydrogenase (NAD+) catalytic subunit